MILSVPEEREQWFRTLFDQFKISHRTLSEEEGEDFRLAELIGEAIAEESSVQEDLPERERQLIDERLTDYRSKPEAVSGFKILLDSLGSK
jgi:hypothetical protein